MNLVRLRDFYREMQTMMKALVPETHDTPVEQSTGERLSGE
jgi:hypothetical protein